MIPYIVNVALILAGCVAFYKILLGRETFYKVNRYVLMGCLVVSFALPLLTIPEQWSLRKKQSSSIQQSKPLLTNLSPLKENLSSKETLQNTIKDKRLNTKSSSGITFSQLMNWMMGIYWFGVIVFAISFLFQLTVLLWKAYTKPVIIDGKYRIIEVNGDKAPCSFGNNIFINPAKYEWETFNQIIQHEKVHIRQGHSFDIMIAELVLIFQWFNPFAWIYRREIGNNLEFLTDEQLVEKENVEKKSYQMSLMKVSAPHFPLNLTTNYNQSILKKRIVMMNSKKSNLHTAWKYFFLLPLLAVFACLLNEPRAHGQAEPKVDVKVKEKHERGIETEGSWFATIKGEKVSMQFKSDDGDQSFNSSDFKLSEFTALPKETSGSFKLTREAGTMEMTGRFEGNTGMGHYKFVADQQYKTYMDNETKDKLDDRDALVFFFMNIQKSFVQSLKGEGYSNLEKDQLITFAAMDVDAPFIKSVKESGFKDVTVDNLVTLKAMNINTTYIQEIRSAGLKNVSIDQLVTLKAQGIDKDYIVKMRKAKAKEGAKDIDEEDVDDIVTFKAMDINDEFVNSYKEVGYNKLSNEELVSLKSLNITPAFIKGFQEVGYKDLDVEELAGLKALNVTPDFIKGFESLGYKNIKIDEINGLKATGVTPEYVKDMKSKGFNYDRLEKYITLKSIQ